jgi:hypothetical protein
VGWDSSVGILTTDWTVRGSNPGGGDFSHPCRSALGPTQPPIKYVPSSSSGGKAAGSGVNHPTLSSAEVKERVELYLYSLSGPSWPVLGLTLPYQCQFAVELLLENVVALMQTDRRMPQYTSRCVF